MFSVFIAIILKTFNQIYFIGWFKNMILHVKVMYIVNQCGRITKEDCY